MNIKIVKKLIIVTVVSCFSFITYSQPILDMSYSPDVIYYGEKHTLTWSTTGANECHNRSGTDIGINGTWSPVRNFVGNGNSTVICTNPEGSTSVTATYRVLSVTPSIDAISSLTADFDSFYGDHWVSGISADVVQMYNRWPAMDALVDMYKATGRIDYIQKALAMGYAYKNAGVDIDNDGFLDWTSPNIAKGYSHFHYEWRAGAGIAKVLGEVFSDVNLSSLKLEAQELLDFTETHVWNKWTTIPNEPLLHETNVTHFIGRAGMIALGLYKATNKSVYVDYIVKGGWELKNSLEHQPETDSYNIICYLSGANCGIANGTIDTSHAGDTVNFIFESYNEGCVKAVIPCIFNEADKNRLVNTISKVLWDQNREFPLFNDLVNGTGSYGSIAYGQNQGGWIKFARFDSDMREMYLRWIHSDNFNTSDFTKAHAIGNLVASYKDAVH